MITLSPKAAERAENELILEFDGSYAGFLCAVAETMNLLSGPQAKRLPELRSAASPHGADLFAERISVTSDTDRAERLLQRIVQRRGRQALHGIELAFACDRTEIDGIATCEAAAHALRRLWLEGEGSQQDLSDPKILAFSKAVNRSQRECHLFKGICRFAELADSEDGAAGTLYAAIKPACDISAFLAEHFADRLANQNWVLHDSGRGSAILHRAGGGLTRVEKLELRHPVPNGTLSPNGSPNPNTVPATGSSPEGSSPETGLPGVGLPVVGSSEGDLPADSLHSFEERQIRRLWQAYFKTVSIAERENPSCQRNFLPLKHRWNLVEFADR